MTDLIVAAKPKQRVLLVPNHSDRRPKTDRFLKYIRIRAKNDKLCKDFVLKFVQKSKMYRGNRLRSHGAEVRYLRYSRASTDSLRAYEER